MGPRVLPLAATWLLIATAAAADGSALEPRADRPFGYQPSLARQALELPERALELLAWPIGAGVRKAEAVDLPNRVLDVLYLDDARTIGWFPNFSFGGEIESAFGVRLFHRSLPGGARVEIGGLFGFPDVEEQRVDFAYRVPDALGDGTELSVAVGYVEDDDEDLFLRLTPAGRPTFGGAPDRSDRTTYELDVVRPRVEAAVVAQGLRVGLALAPIWAEVEAGQGSAPPIPRAVDGFGGPAILVGGGPFVEIDGRDDALRPTRGAFLRLEAGGWGSVRGSSSRDEPYRWVRLGADGQVIVPTFRPDRRFVFRGVLDRVESIDGGTVPFYELPVLDEDTLLRGFRRNRFRDRGSLLLNVEYRYPVWDTWDAYAFLDEGQVFREFSRLELGRFEWSAGFGIRLFTESSFLVRIELATSEEEQIFRFGLDQAL